jgi:hypothetical protein
MVYVIAHPTNQFTQRYVDDGGWVSRVGRIKAKLDCVIELTGPFRVETPTQRERFLDALNFMRIRGRQRVDHFRWCPPPESVRIPLTEDERLPHFELASGISAPRRAY